MEDGQGYKPVMDLAQCCFETMYDICIHLQACSPFFAAWKAVTCLVACAHHLELTAGLPSHAFHLQARGAVFPSCHLSVDFLTAAATTKSQHPSNAHLLSSRLKMLWVIVSRDSYVTETYGTADVDAQISTLHCSQQPKADFIATQPTKPFCDRLE